MEEILLWSGIVGAGAGVLGVFWAVYAHFAGRNETGSPGPEVEAPHGGMATGSDFSPSASGGGKHTVAGRDVNINERDPTIPLLVEVMKKQLDTKDLREQEYQEQVKALTEAITALTEQKGQPDAPLGIDDALASLQQGNPDRAEAIFLEVETRRASEGQAALKEAAAAARHRGALAFPHSTQKALGAYRRATELDPENLDGWNILGRLFLRLGGLGDAESACGQVLALAEQSQDRSWMAAAYDNLGTIYRTRGELDRAEEAHLKSLGLCEELDQKEGMAASSVNLGLIYEARGELERAEEAFLKALGLTEELGSKQVMARAYGNLGLIYEARGELERAEEAYLKSLGLNEELGSKEGMFAVYGNLGTIYRTRGELDRAEKALLKSLGLCEELDEKVGMAFGHGSLGLVYWTGGELERAEEELLKALGLSEELGIEDGVARAYGNLGLIYHTRGELDRAEVALLKALDLFEEIGAQPDVETIRGNLEKLAEL